MSPGSREPSSTRCAATPRRPNQPLGGYRAFTLGHEVDEANAQARYVNGVLELTLPKSPNAMPKKITIH